MMVKPGNKFIWLIILLLMAGLFVFKACSDSSTSLGPPPDDEIVDSISGLMLMRGVKTTTTYFPEGEKPDVESEHVNFLVKLKLSSENDDSVRIYGLEGADTGKFDHRVFPGCTHPDDCKVHGRMTGIRNFKVDLNHQGRTYKATAVYQTVDFDIQAEYQYQNVTIHYDLTGERIFD
jgi:hypothetical protein